MDKPCPPGCNACYWDEPNLKMICHGNHRLWKGNNCKYQSWNKCDCEGHRCKACHWK